MVVSDDSDGLAGLPRKGKSERRHYNTVTWVWCASGGVLQSAATSARHAQPDLPKSLKPTVYGLRVTSRAEVKAQLQAEETEGTVVVTSVLNSDPVTQWSVWRGAE
jgi:hypothetical protein